MPEMQKSEFVVVAMRPVTSAVMNVVGTRQSHNSRSYRRSF